MVKIGDRCILRKTGNLGLATVIGIIDSRTYNNVMFGHAKLWDELYPGWKDNPLVFLEFDKPQRNMSLKEYCNTYSENENFKSLSDKEKEYCYTKNVPEVIFTQTPIDDIDII